MPFGLAPISLLADNTTAASKASDASTAIQLEKIYDYSGVDAHLGWVLSTVEQEASLAHANCAKQDALPDLNQSLKELLSIEALRNGFLAELQSRLNQTQRDEILAWIVSDAGKKIHKTERDSINYDESKFEKMFAKFRDSEKNTQERNTRMRHMLADTGAVYFISAVNTETSALVAMASACSSSSEDIEKAAGVVRDERGEEPLYRTFMRQELIVPSSVIYQNVSDEDIDAYSEFANTDAGNAYFSALIKGVRAVLAAKVDSLKLTLEAM